MFVEVPPALARRMMLVPLQSDPTIQIPELVVDLLIQSNRPRRSRASLL